MNKVARIVVLLTGASSSGFLFDGPALAATNTVAGMVYLDTGANVTDTLDISNIGTTEVSSTNNPAAALVNGVASGRIFQFGTCDGRRPKRERRFC